MWSIYGTLMSVYSVTLIFSSDIISVSIWCFYRTCVILGADDFHAYRNDTSEQYDLLVRCIKSELNALSWSCFFQNCWAL